MCFLQEYLNCDVQYLKCYKSSSMVTLPPPAWMTLDHPPCFHSPTGYSTQMALFLEMFACSWLKKTEQNR